MRSFCAADSRDRGEEIFGTVAFVRSWMLLEYPGAWRRNALEGTRLVPDPVKEYIGRTAERCLLVRREHRWRGPLSCFRVDSRLESPSIRRGEVTSYEELPTVSMSEAPSAPMYAVCTHGRHDKCCSKFGLPVYCALREIVGEQAWQCSHVGGDRFAGNVVVFPWGIYYGRVTPEEVSDIVRSTERGEVWLAGYRGRSCFRRPAQVAEYFARRETGLLRINEFSPKRVDQISTDITRVELQSKRGVHSVEFRTTLDAEPFPLTCHAETPSAAPRYELIRHTLSD